jgi:hypothetical protein
MIELTAPRKNKVVLSDYDYKRDIENRLLLASFTINDYAVLEDILFSPIRTTVRKIAKNIDIADDLVLSILQKLAQTGLISFEDDAIIVDKEMRKYFETEAERFNEEFLPGMDFIQHLLKKVPIHVLPHWYAIPRTSNNIFDSIIEKYLHTPQIFQRYLMELNFQDPALSAITQDILKSPNFELPADQVRKKYNLSDEQFHEIILYLEFHFICTLVYRKEGSQWQEVISLFHEWKEHLSFFKETTPAQMTDLKKIRRYRPTDFSFVDDMAAILAYAQKNPSFLAQKGEPIILPSPTPDDLYLKRLLVKIEQIDLACVENRKFVLTDAGIEWLDLKPESRALYLYRHPSNYCLSAAVSPLLNEKMVRELEKSILRILRCGWVRFSDFVQGLCVPVGEGRAITLQKTGKHWKYQRPVYSQEEVSLIQSVVLDHLFETGITAIGSIDGETCLCVTPFGQSLFG